MGVRSDLASLPSVTITWPRALTISTVMALAAAISSVSAAKQQLGSMIPRSEHAADVNAIGDTVRQLRVDIRRDSLMRAREDTQRDVMLERIDRRVSAMYCAGKPPGCQ